jgi:hypothetical protein
MASANGYHVCLRTLQPSYGSAAIRMTMPSTSCSLLMGGCAACLTISIDAPA